MDTVAAHTVDTAEAPTAVTVAELTAAMVVGAAVTADMAAMELTADTVADTPVAAGVVVTVADTPVAAGVADTRVADTPVADMAVADMAVVITKLRAGESRQRPGLKPGLFSWKAKIPLLQAGMSLFSVGHARWTFLIVR